MKKIILALTLILSISTLFGQANKTKKLQKFTELSVYDRIHVTLKKGKENKLVLSGKNQEDIVVSEKNGVLKIKMKFDEFLSGHIVSATLFYNTPLTLIDANENAQIQTTETVKGSKITIKAQEAALISLQVDADYLKVKSSTRSEINLKGKTIAQEIDIHTGGKLYAKNLTAKESTVIVLAGGYAAIYGTEKVIAKVKAGGEINIYGRPKNLETDDTFGGKIKIMQ